MQTTWYPGAPANICPQQSTECNQMHAEVMDREIAIQCVIGISIHIFQHLLGATEHVSAFPECSYVET